MTWWSSVMHHDYDMTRERRVKASGLAQARRSGSAFLVLCRLGSSLRPLAHDASVRFLCRYILL